MPLRKPKKLTATQRKAIASTLDKFMMALGLSVVMLKQTQKALRKDVVTLRVNALAFRGGVRGLQRMQRSLFAQLEEAGVLGKRAA